MASEVKLPELGENLESGEVLELRVNPGDSVTEGQTLLELEAEKSTVEVPAPMAGRVTQLLVKKGDKVQVGQTIALMEGGDGKGETPKEAPVREAGDTQAVEPEPRGATRTKEPSPDSQKPVQKDQEPAPKSEPQRRPQPAQAEGPRPQAPSEGNGQRPAERPVAPSGPPTIGEERSVRAGPATRRLARELGVELRLVTGSARGGRVTADDVKAYVRQLAAGATTGPAPGGIAPPLPDFARWGPIQVKPLDPIRRKTAENVSLAWRLIPHVTQHDEADITELDTFRRQQEAAGPKLTPTAFALKACASALKQFPQFNASVDVAGGKLVLKSYYHIGVAVDTDHGLLVPVLREVDKKSVRELAQELSAVAERARQRKVTIEEMRGGTFTITNLGGIGGTGFSPIVNFPEVAILGLSRARLMPVVRDGQVVPRLILPLSVSYDHRVIDGADAARFTRRLKEMMENPLQMLL